MSRTASSFELAGRVTERAVMTSMVGCRRADVEYSRTRGASELRCDAIDISRAEGRPGGRMKLLTITQVSVDGVMQAPGVNLAEGDSSMVERRGWAHFDDEAGLVMNEVFQNAGAFLFGRRTYDHFASTWGAWDDPGDSPIWTALHTKPKYVASSTLTDPAWENTTVLPGALTAAIRELRAEPGRELQVHGSGALLRWLFAHELVDEINLFTFP